MREQQNYTAGIYCRLSSEDSAEHESMSIGNQKAMLSDYVKRHGWEVGDIYIDDGYSGTNFERPDFKRMIGDIENGKINMVVVKDLSRLGRNYIMCGQYTEIYFPEKGVRFIAVNDNVDTINNTGSMDITPFKHILNDMYAKDISTKIKSSLHMKAMRGEYLGALDPYGYVRDPKDKHKLLVNEETAPIVKRIFEMCAGGMGSRSIATTLNNEGVLSPAEYNRFKNHDPEKDGAFVRKRYWCQTYIRTMLQNEMFIGSMVQGRHYTPSYRTKKRVKNDREDWIVVKGMHEPIISEELFEQAQKALHSRKIQPRKDSPHHVDPDVFSGLFRCEACGTAMRKHRTHNGKYIYYVCGRHHQQGKFACSSHYINCDVITRLVREDIKRNAVLFTEDTERAVRELTEKKCSDDQKKMSQMKSELTASRNQLAGLDAKLRRAYEDNLSGKLPDHIFTMLIGNYDEEKETLQRTIRELEKRIDASNAARSDVERFSKLIQKYTSFEELDSFMLHELIEKITIYETPNMGRYRKGKEKIVTIYYKFVGALE